MRHKWKDSVSLWTTRVCIQCGTRHKFGGRRLPSRAWATYYLAKDGTKSASLPPCKAQKEKVK